MATLEVFLEGEISRDEASHASRLLELRGTPFRFKLRDASANSNAFEAPELLATAAAIAGVLSFVHQLWSSRSSSQDDNGESKKEIEDRLRDFDAEGFEVESVELYDEITSVKMNDVPSGRWIEIEVKRQESVCIRRGTIHHELED